MTLRLPSVAQGKALRLRSVAQGEPRRTGSRSSVGTSGSATAERVVIRRGRASDVPSLYRLIAENERAGHLLPRTLSDLLAHVHRFIVAEEDEEIAGCTDVAPLSDGTAEIRSLVVATGHRGRGIATSLIRAAERVAQAEGYDVLCAFTHTPGPFRTWGFEMVEHAQVPEKIETDCSACTKFGDCDQVAFVRPLNSTSRRGAQALSARRIENGSMAMAR